jgi:hypothetical protein
MSKKTEPTVKKSKRHLRCKFNSEELLVIGTELAESNNSLSALEEDKARVVSDYAARIKSAEATVSIAAHKISSGYEFRDVPVTIRMHEPESGKKTVFRDDSNEMVAVEEMTQEELQPELIEDGKTNPAPE